MEFKTILYNSDEYTQVVALRQRILRDPLGLKFSEEDLKRDADEVICVCVENREVVGCNQLVYINDKIIKIRQMAVDNTLQTKGIGSQLLHYAEDIARKKDYKIIELHARLISTGFYKKNGYTVVSDIFEEVGIPHVKMKKEF